MVYVQVRLYYRCSLTFFLAVHDRVLNEFFQDSIVKRVFRFVDDYLVILDCRLEAIHLEAPSILSQFSSVLNPLIVTNELPFNDFI